MTDRQAATVPWDAADIHRLIRSGDFASARDRIETALTGNPHHVQARMMRVRLALAEGDLEDAARQSSTLLRAHPDNGWIVLLRVEAMAVTGQPDAAIDTLVEHLTPEIAQHPSLVQTVDGLITKERSLAIRAHLIRRLTPVAAASPAVAVRLAHRSALVGRVQDAEALLGLAERHGPMPVEATPLRAKVLMAQSRYREAVDRLVPYLAGKPADRAATRILIRALSGAGDLDQAQRVLIRAIEAQPDDWLLVYRYNRMLLPADRDAYILSVLEKAGPIEGQSPLWQFQYAIAASRQRPLGPVVDLLRMIGADPHMAPMAAPALAAFETIDADPAGGACRIDADRSRTVNVVRTPGAVATLVVFGSVVGGMGYVDFNLLDRLLQDLPANIVYLRDPLMAGFLRGVPGLGEDEASATAALRDLLADLGAPRLVTAGSSIAGYAALRYGLVLAADHVLSFAGPVALDDERSDDDAQDGAPGHRELRALTPDWHDLTDLVRRTPSCHLTVVIGADNGADRRRADRLSDIPHATVIALDGVSHHFPVLELIADGRFVPVLERALTHRRSVDDPGSGPAAPAVAGPRDADRSDDGPPRIAVFGTFDVDNYGDVLFPLLAQARLKRLGIEVSAISPTAARPIWHDARPATAIADFATRPRGTTGILIGGGNLVHLKAFPTPAYEQAGLMPVAYPALWLGATALAAVADCPIAWNAPGVIDLSEAARNAGLVRSALAAADHLAVRDRPSADLLGTFGRRADCVPDSAFGLADLWPEARLAERKATALRRRGIDPETAYLVVHVKERSLGQIAIGELAGRIDRLSEETGLLPVFLALGPCHGDAEVAVTLDAACRSPTVCMARPERLEDIAALIAGARIALVASLHGFITALVYRTPARLVAVPALGKFRGTAEMVGRMSDLVEDWHAALSGAGAALREAPRSAPLPGDIPAALDRHWQRIARLASGEGTAAAARRRDRLEFLHRMIQASMPGQPILTMLSRAFELGSATGTPPSAPDR